MLPIKKISENIKHRSAKRHCRSSLQVNLSYVIDLSDSENSENSESSQEKSQKNNGIGKNFQISVNNDLSYVLSHINKKDEDLNQTCTRLREAILNKTREMFDNQNEFCEKTKQVLASDAPKDPGTLKQSPILRSSNLCNIMKPSRSRNAPETTRSQMTNDFQDESLVLGNPVISSTLINHHSTIDESCPSPTSSRHVKKSYGFNNAEVGPSSAGKDILQDKKSTPIITNVENCRIRVNKIIRDSKMEKSKNLANIPMELTEIQGNCVLNESPKRIRKIIKGASKRVIENESQRMNRSMYVNTSLDPQMTHYTRAIIHDRPANCRDTQIEEANTDTDDSDDQLSRVDKLRNISQPSETYPPSAGRMNNVPEVVDPSPILPTKSMLIKSQLQQMTADNNATRLRLRKTVTNSRTQQPPKKINLEKTLVLKDLSFRGNYSSTCPEIIPESPDESSELHNATNPKTPKVRRKKLFTQHDSPGRAISFSPLTSDIANSPIIPKKVKRRRIRRNLAGKIIQSQFATQPQVQTQPPRSQQPRSQMPQPSLTSSSTSSQETGRGRRLEKSPKKKKRLIKSKKIVVKKPIRNILSVRADSISDCRSSQISRRSSIFMDNNRLTRRKRSQSNARMRIVATGLCNGDKDIVKESIKVLGGAVLEPVVSRKTTHVVTTGVRTINLLRGIVRGCWLVNFDWVLKSIEAAQWLDAEKYEVTNFSKAVKENRRDREIFGSAYVCDLFATCGLINIEKNTIPPRDILKELIKIAGGRFIEEPKKAKIVIGPTGIKENWILDSITAGELQPIDQYSR